MIRFIARLFLLASIATAFLFGTDANTSPPQADEKWKLVWQDEFDGKDIDRTKWDHDLGNGFFNYDANTWIGGWGNGELQYYTREPENAFVKDGLLHLRAIKESLHNCGYSSAKLKTRKRDGTSLFAMKFGKVEFRAKLPTGKGVVGKFTDPVLPELQTMRLEFLGQPGLPGAPM